LKYLYYPGCSLKNTYPEFEKSALAVCKKLDILMEEIPDWCCCGVVSSLAVDNIMRLLGAVRTLIKAQERGKEIESNTLVSLCSMCYNVLKKVNHLLSKDPETLQNINDFIEEEPDYTAELEVIHLLKVLEDYGFYKIGDELVYPLTNLKVATYYGCALIRPNEVAICDVEKPRLFEHLIRCLGAKTSEFSYKIQCCGNYHVVDEPEIVQMRGSKIIESARLGGADIILSSCPLCTFNLNQANASLKEEHRIPIIFFTQLLALALDVENYLPKKEKNLVLKSTGVSTFV
jgi:heterodisulfide reductase subunit B